MKLKGVLINLALIASALGSGAMVAHQGEASAAAQPGDSVVSLPGMASISGTVDAPKTFKAAQVYLRSIDKAILYMVYTDKGAFRAVSLFPGRYEVDIESKDLESGVTQVALQAGDNAQLKLHMHASPGHVPSGSQDISNPPAQPNEEEFPRVLIEDYDQVYPPGPARATVEKVCMVCHFEDYLPSRPRSEAAWKQATMNWPDGCLSGSAAAPPAAMFLMTDKERAEVLAYLAEHFGPTEKPRVVRTTQSVSLDEGALAKAEFIEYYLKGDSEPVPPGGAPGANGLSQYRTLFTMQLDDDGNVWGVDRGVPNRLVKLDPRTGIQKDFVMPDPIAGVHEILIDRSGMIWVPEFDGVPARREYRLVQFNPKTEKWRLINADPDHVIVDSTTGMLGVGLDSKGNIYMNWIADGYVSRWERSTGKISFYRVPTAAAQPYGLDVDKNDNVWVAVSSDGKLGKLDPNSNDWTLFVPSTYPAYVRRGVGGSSVDSNERVWFGVYAAGKRPGTLNMLNQATGRITQWKIPFQDAQPYEVSVGPNDVVWFPSQGTPDNPAVLGRFDPQTQAFTFYPKPQFIADSAKLQFATNGSVWFAPRFGAPSGHSGFGVLYPDKDKIGSLAAYPQNGAPGYAYQISASGTKAH